LNIFQEELDVKEFMARHFSQVAHEILADREGSENQTNSDIHVKSFLTRELGEMKGA
jgi:hypothetical protein